MKRTTLGTALTVAVTAFWVSPGVALDDADKCATQKMKEAGKYVYCRMKAEAKAVKKGTAPDFSKCDSKFADKWAKIETKASGACPTTGDVGGVANVAVAGSGLMAGTVTAASRFQNNGDGTTTDLQTGLTWENKSHNDGSVHDIFTRHTFQQASSVHVATLNATTFAGRDDWRVPTPHELVSLINFANPNDIKSYPEFDFNCEFTCELPLCPSPTFDNVSSNCAFAEISGPESYWTSTTNAEDSDEAVAVSNWGFILEVEESKSSEYPVIAVRGGNSE